jgi:hypothetical protein
LNLFFCIRSPFYFPSLFAGSDQTTGAENFDRGDITLVGAQEALVKAVLAAQPKTVVVLIHGGPIASPVVHDEVGTWSMSLGSSAGQKDGSGEWVC